MHFQIKTKVPQNYQKVFEGFDQSLFLKLKPPGMGIKLHRFDGCQKGDEIHLELSSLGIRQEWVSLVTQFERGAQSILFVDEGQKIPRPLKSWRHQHFILNQGNHSTIVDDVTYHTKFLLLDILFFPLVYLTFFYRKPIYRSYFSKGNLAQDLGKDGN